MITGGRIGLGTSNFFRQGLGNVPLCSVVCTMWSNAKKVNKTAPENVVFLQSMGALQEYVQD